MEYLIELNYHTQIKHQVNMSETIKARTSFKQNMIFKSIEI